MICSCLVPLVTLQYPRCIDIASKYVGQWTAPPTRVPTQKLVDGPIVGNGDMGVTIGGPAEELTFYVGLNQFWALTNWTHASVPGQMDRRPFPAPVAVARLTLRAPDREPFSHQIAGGGVVPATRARAPHRL